MQKFIKLTTLGAVAVLFFTVKQSHGQTQPQGRPGGFDPEQIRQRIMDRMREQFDVKDDAEWKLISDRITAVFEAQRVARGGFGGFGMIGGRPPGGGDQGATGGASPAGGGGFRSFSQPDPVAEDLQRAVEAKASPDVIKEKLAKLRDSRKDKEAKLEKAQEELKQILSVRQEAVAVLFGMLK